MRKTIAQAPRLPPSRPRPLLASGGFVRIIGGTLRGSKLAVAPNPGLRPTPDRVRETLFNWLTPHLPNAVVLDAFAGTGALGIEALSRGAERAIFIEKDAALVDALRATLLRLRVDSRAVVFCGELAQIAHLQATHLSGSVDIALIDPPFAAALHAETLMQLTPLLQPNAIAYLEAPKNQALEPGPAWRPWKSASAGAVAFGLWQRAL